MFPTTPNEVRDNYMFALESRAKKFADEDSDAVKYAGQSEGPGANAIFFAVVLAGMVIVTRTHPDEKIYWAVCGVVLTMFALNLTKYVTAKVRYRNAREKRDVAAKNLYLGAMTAIDSHKAVEGKN